MKHDFDEDDNYVYELEIERPYGKIDDACIVYRRNTLPEDDPNYETLTELTS